MNVDLFIKVVLFYSELLKRVAIKQLSLNSTLIKSLLQHVINQMSQKEGDMDDNMNEFTKLNEVIDDINVNAMQLCQFIDDKVVYMLT